MRTSSLLLALASCLFLVAPGLQARGEEPPAPQGTLTKAPELLEFIEAVYPPEAEAQKLTGDVGLLVDLDETGAVTHVEVTEPAGHGFDEAAVEAIGRFRFSPAEIDGAPAAVRIAYRYHFVLRPEREAPPVEATLNFRGTVRQRGTREPVPNASIGFDLLPHTATSGSDGAFEIAGVPAGEHKVLVTAPGFERFETEEEFVEGKATAVTYYLRKKVYSPYETVVRDRKERKEVARVELKQEEIRLIPGTQGDAFKVVQNLPGVARAPYGFGLLVVRGGRPGDTRTYVDGVHIPLLFHFGGLTSVFNSNLLEGLSFQPGNFGAHLGRATAGAVEATSRTPSKSGVHGYVDVSLLDTSALVEAPVGGDWSAAAAGRVSYVDLILSAVLSDSISFVTAPRYWDYQLKLERIPEGKREGLRFMAFGSNDSLKVLLDNPAMVDPEGRNSLGVSMGFHRLTGSYSSRLSERVHNRAFASVGVDFMTNNFGDDIGGKMRLYSVQFGDALTLEVDRSLELEFGLDGYAGAFDADVTAPSIPPPDAIPDPFLSQRLVRTQLDGLYLEPALFLQATWKPWRGARIIPGVRADYEHTLRYVTVDPRLSLFQEVGPTTVLKGALGLYQQPPDYRMGQWTPEFGNPELGAEQSLHSMVGVEQQLTDALSLDLQLYDKQSWHLVRQSDRTIARDGEPVQEHYANVGEGHSYGVELLLRHALTDRFFGWISYSLSRSELRNPRSKTDDGWILNNFDQPHHLIMVASYKWPNNWTTGVRLQYASGNLETPATGYFYDADADSYWGFSGEPNSIRAPDFFSLDLRVDRQWVFRAWTLSAYLDIQNVTNNTNPERLIYNYDFTKHAYLRGLPIFPTLGVKAEF